MEKSCLALMFPNKTRQLSWQSGLTLYTLALNSLRLQGLFLDKEELMNLKELTTCCLKTLGSLRHHILQAPMY